MTLSRQSLSPGSASRIFDPIRQPLIESAKSCVCAGIGEAVGEDFGGQRFRHDDDDDDDDDDECLCLLCVPKRLVLFCPGGHEHDRKNNID